LLKCASLLQLIPARVRHRGIQEELVEIITQIVVLRDIAHAAFCGIRPCEEAFPRPTDEKARALPTLFPQIITEEQADERGDLVIFC